MNLVENRRVVVGEILDVSRPRFWLYLAGPVLVGAAWGAVAAEDLWSLPVVALFAYFLLPANILLYGVNDLFDAEIDRHNPKKFDRERRWQDDPVVLAAIVAAGALGLVVFFLTPPIAWPYLLGFFALAIAYSAPPLRFKARPGFDSMSNGLYILPGGAVYTSLAGEHVPLLVLFGAWLWTMGMHTFSAIPDIAPDRQSGIRTTATALGERWTVGYCLVCWVGAVVGFGLVDIWAGLLMAVYPLLLGWMHVSRQSIRRTYWWFPWINAIVGGVWTIAGLWYLVNGGGIS